MPNENFTQLLSGVIESETTAEFRVPPYLGGQSWTLFAHGLQGSEVVALDLLAVNTDSPEETDWMAVYIAGSAQQLTPTDNLGVIVSPGYYRVRCASSAGSISVGLYKGVYP